MFSSVKKLWGLTPSCNTGRFELWCHLWSGGIFQMALKRLRIFFIRFIAVFFLSPSIIPVIFWLLSVHLLWFGFGCCLYCPELSDDVTLNLHLSHSSSRPEGGWCCSYFQVWNSVNKTQSFLPSALPLPPSLILMNYAEYFTLMGD